MKYDVFYCCYGSGEEVSSDECVSMAPRDIYVFAFSILEEPDDFFGIVDTHGTTLQIMVEPNDVFWTEIPDPARRGSTGARLSFDALVDVLKSLDGPLTASMIPEAGFEPW